MQKIAKFEFVDKKQFEKDFADNLGYEMPEDTFECLKLPKRATKGSAGYDFYVPVDITLKPKETITIPTGIRAKMNEDWVLCIFPRSGLGFKYKVQLNNTVGIIDSDYYYSDNEGHIKIRITNDNNENKTLHLEAGKGFAQGIFFQYGITEDDETSEVRNGGLGSTDKK